MYITYEIICVNDGSKDNTLQALVEHHHRNPCIKVVNLSRNFGKEVALSAGIDYASGAAAIPIDPDLQDSPELIGELVEKWREGYDVVYATLRSHQGESCLKRSTAYTFYRTIGKMSPVPIPPDTGDLGQLLLSPLLKFDSLEFPNRCGGCYSKQRYRFEY